jgi:hypothetical protein
MADPLRSKLIVHRYSHTCPTLLLLFALFPESSKHKALQFLLAERENDFLPTRFICPSAIDNNHRAVQEMACLDQSWTTTIFPPASLASMTRLT